MALTLEDYLPLLMAARDRGIGQVFREAAGADLTGNDALSTEQFSDVPLELADTLQRAGIAGAVRTMEQPEDLAEATKPVAPYPASRFCQGRIFVSPCCRQISR